MTSMVSCRVVPNRTVALTAEQTENLLRLQRDVLAEVVQHHNYQSTLNRLCTLAEDLLSDSMASIMLFDDQRTSLVVRAAPTIPLKAIEALNGLKPGPNAGSCGTAVFREEPQFVCDTSSDPCWGNDALQSFAEEFNIRACWSMPIRVGSQVVGSLALSSFEKRKPSEFQRMLLETGAFLAGIVLEREREQQRLWDLAHYDSLTNLPNRRLFNLKLAQKIDYVRTSGRKLALLFIDLDDFKDINDTLGHGAGDVVLSLVADNLRTVLRPDDVIARLGGDEFVVLLVDVEDPIAVQGVADELLAAIEKPIRLEGRGYRLTASIGISLYPDDGEDLQTLHKSADLALHEAKAKGRGRYIYFRPDLASYVESRTAMVGDLRQTIAEQGFSLEYQPQIATADGRLAGAEALVRWHHPGKGSIPPFEFIPLAEETGLIVELGEWVLRTACLQCLDWWEKGLDEFMVAINLSVMQLREGFTEHLLAMLREIDFPLRWLELEITESMVMDSGGEAIEELQKLNQAGISISMDDFGTGHSSLAQLKRMPISKLKIDRSFVRDIPDDPNDLLIARTIIAMGHGLGLEVVAEGVETQVQKAFLEQEGCDYLQGYLIARPLPPLDFEGFVRGRSRLV